MKEKLILISNPLKKKDSIYDKLMDDSNYKSWSIPMDKEKISSDLQKMIDDGEIVIIDDFSDINSETIKKLNKQDPVLFKTQYLGEPWIPKEHKA